MPPEPTPAALRGRHLVLVGFMGAGKSALGRALAPRLGRRHHDSDAVLERRGRPIAAFFAAGEEPAFRALEAEVVRALVARPPAVLSLGGGALEDADTRALLLDRCLVVHLHVPWPDLRASLPALRARRPLLQGRTEEDIHALYERRLVAYGEAHLRVEVPRTTLAAGSDRVLAALESCC